MGDHKLAAVTDLAPTIEVGKNAPIKAEPKWDMVGAHSSFGPRDHLSMRIAQRVLVAEEIVLRPTPKIPWYSRATFSWLVRIPPFATRFKNSFAPSVQLLVPCTSPRGAWFPRHSEFFRLAAGDSKRHHVTNCARQNSTVKLGYKRNGEGKNLEQSDLWVLQEHLRVETMNRKFLELWEEERKRPKPSIRRALWRLIRSTCLASSIFELIRLVGSFANPMIVREIIVFIQSPTMDFTYGITLAFLLCAGAIAVAFGKSHSFHFVMNAGAMVKGAINAGEEPFGCALGMLPAL